MKKDIYEDVVVLEKKAGSIHMDKSLIPTEGITGVYRDYRIPPRKPLPLGMGMNRHVRRDDLRKLSCKTTKFLL